jgi:hypothetical protein
MPNAKKKLVLNQETVQCLQIGHGQGTDTRPAPVGTRLLGCTGTK